MSQTIKQRYVARIVRFIVFNKSWGTREGDEIEKIIYFQSHDQKNDADTEFKPDFSEYEKSELESIVNDVGLCESATQFVKIFGENEEISAIHGSKVRFVIEEVEPDYMMCLNLSLPKSVVKTNVLKDEQMDQQYVEYHDEELNDYFVKLLIYQIYESFYLLNGTFEKLWKKCGENRTSLRDVCSRFFSWFLPTIKPFSVNLVELFGAIQYLPLDNLTFLESQSFVNQVMFCDPLCAHVLFLYNEQLISSSLDLKNTRILYRYLVSQLIPETACEEMSESVITKSQKRTRFVKKGVRIYLRTEQSYLMNIYRSVNGTTVVLLFKDNDMDNEEALNKCDVLMAARLQDLSLKLAEVSVRISSQEIQSTAALNDPMQPDFFKFAYFNSSNAAYKSNSGASGILDHRKISDSEFVKLIIDIESDLKTILSSSNDASNLIEIVAKTVNESWLVVHNADARTLFSLLNHKNANLLEACDTVAIHLSKQFNNILFID